MRYGRRSKVTSSPPRATSAASASTAASRHCSLTSSNRRRSGLARIDAAASARSFGDAVSITRRIARSARRRPAADPCASASAFRSRAIAAPSSSAVSNARVVGARDSASAASSASAGAADDDDDDDAHAEPRVRDGATGRSRARSDGLGDFEPADAELLARFEDDGEAEPRSDAPLMSALARAACCDGAVFAFRDAHIASTDESPPSTPPIVAGAARGSVVGVPEPLTRLFRCVLYKSFSPIARFQHLIATPFN
eukprot:31242-Pelagococcus_subviridis.AAC.6